MEATAPDATAYWTGGRHRLWAEVWDALVLPDAQAENAPAENATFRMVAVLDFTLRPAVGFGLHLADFGKMNTAVTNLETVVLRVGEALLG